MSSETIGSPAALLHTAPRVAAVLKILKRHGFGGLLSGSPVWPDPEQVRSAVEELGVVSIKFGQILSTRADLLPPEYIQSLESLQDHVAPLSYDTIRDALLSELGGEPDTLFSEFDPAPLASASIAQVHVAVFEGRDVVVKVQRPGLKAIVEKDILVLAHLAAAVDLGIPRLRAFDLPGLVRDFRRTLEAELDFRREAENIRRFEQSLADESGVWIPTPIDERSGPRVLTMERSHGVRLDRFTESAGHERKELAQRIGKLFIKQVFRDGLFHADPHPGNFFVLPDGRICLHDFGMVGELDEHMREALARLVDATVAGDPRAATHAFLDMGLLPRDIDRSALEVEVGELVADIRRRPLAEVSIGEALGSLARLGGKHKMHNPGTVMLLSRAFITLEGVLASLDPDLGFIELFGEAFKETLGSRLSADRLRRDALVALRAVDELVREAPDDVRRLLRQWGDGSLGQVVVRSDPTELQQQRADSYAKRRTLASGFIAISGSVLLSMGSEWQVPVGTGLLALGVVGVLFALRRGR
jgi:ubiquinone biosynthesis protein